MLYFETNLHVGQLGDQAEHADLVARARLHDDVAILLAFRLRGRLEHQTFLNLTDPEFLSRLINPRRM